MSMIWAPLRARPKARQVSAAAYTYEVGKLGEGDKTGGDRRRHRASQKLKPDDATYAAVIRKRKAKEYARRKRKLGKDVQPR
jgi:hypothetical protein